MRRTLTTLVVLTAAAGTAVAREPTGQEIVDKVLEVDAWGLHGARMASTVKVRDERDQKERKLNFTGISKPPESLGKDDAIAIPDAAGKAGYLTTDKTADNSGTLLEYIFNNIVQNSETPEFLLGTAIASSKASAEEQIATIVAKAKRKQKQLKKVLRKLIDAYVLT